MAFSPPANVKIPEKITNTVTLCHIGMPKIWRTKMPPLNNPNDSQLTKILTMAYHAKIVCVLSP